MVFLENYYSYSQINHLYFTYFNLDRLPFPHHFITLRHFLPSLLTSIFYSTQSP